MKKEKVSIILMVILMSFSLLSCGEKEDPATPVTPVVTTPDYLGDWSGTCNHPTDSLQFTFTNIDGKAMLTSLTIAATYISPTDTATLSTEYDSVVDGFVEVVDSAFTTTILGTGISGSKLDIDCQFSTKSQGSGSYKVTWLPYQAPVTDSLSVTGTFTAVLN